ncbi:MAG: RNA-binding protein [Bacteroidia bacterium]|jgi:RNA recognition motif-containing protein|nr:RNA-binding protein [Bacteroidia bacterium]
MKLLVSNLDAYTSVFDLTGLFEEFGPVRRVVRGRMPGASGYVAMIDMEDDLDAADATEELDGQPFDGSVLKVQAATPAEEAQFRPDQDEDDDEDDFTPGRQFERIQRKKPGREQENRDKNDRFGRKGKF